MTPESLIVMNHFNMVNYESDDNAALDQPAIVLEDPLIELKTIQSENKAEQ